jgi:hypothetical protein
MKLLDGASSGAALLLRLFFSKIRGAKGADDDVEVHFGIAVVAEFLTFFRLHRGLS